MGNVEYNLGLFIGNNLWQSIAVLMVVLGILKLVKSSTAEERSWSWTAALIAVAILPLASFLPGDGAGLFESLAKEKNLVSTEAQLSAVTQLPLNNKMVNDEVVVNTSFFNPESVYFAGITLLWIVGTLFALSRLAIAWSNSNNLTRSAYPYEGFKGLSIPAGVEVAINNDISGPIVVGLINPVILLPRSFAFEMETSELEPLLHHEVAHIKRYDNIFYLVERLVLAVYWWNPVMFYIAKCVAEERELACDDRAAKRCGDNLIYAKSLLNGARKLTGKHMPIVGLAALSRESVLSERIKRLTNHSRIIQVNAKRIVKNTAFLMIAVLTLGIITPRIDVGYFAASAQEVTVEQDIAENRVFENDNEMNAQIRSSIEAGLKNLPNELDLEKMRAQIEMAIENLPTKEMVDAMRVSIRKNMDDLPNQIDAEKIRANIERGLKNLPEGVEGEKIRIEVEEALREAMVEVDVDKIRAEMEESLTDLPTEEEIIKMREDLKRELANIITEEDLKEMRLEIERTLENLPSDDEI